MSAGAYAPYAAQPALRRSRGSHDALRRHLNGVMS